MAEISVVMPVYMDRNISEEVREELLDYMRCSVDSILNQTHKDFELILVCEHGTSAECMEVVESYKTLDQRVLVIQNKERLGISASLNVGIKSATGDYIARMDTDDISGMRRLEIQKSFMDYYKELGIIGVKHRVDNSPTWWVDCHTDPLQVDSELLFFVPLRHPSIFIRKSLIYEHDLFYDETLPGTEDYDLFIRAAKVTRLSNIDEPDLFTYRRTGKNASLLNKDTDNERRLKLMKQQFIDRLSLNFQDDELEILCPFTTYKKRKSGEYAETLEWLESLLDQVVVKNQCVEEYDITCLKNTMRHRWFIARKYMSYETSNIPKKAQDVWKNSRYHDEWMD